MDKNTCKLCFRRFSNGRALGGHMRSHVTSSTTTKPPPPPPPLLYSSSSSSGPEQEEPDHPPAVVGSSGLCYGLRENPRKSFRLVDPEFSDRVLFHSTSAAVVLDGESETESCKQHVIGTATSSISRRRSKRRRRCSPKAAETEPVSSVSETTPDEDVALCLIMLSRDSWPKTQQEQDVEDEEDGEERAEQLEAEPSDAERKLLSSVRSRKPGGRSRYKCFTCNKVFRSYQALGGHRANHKKLKPAMVVDTNDDNHHHHLTQELDCEQNGEDSRIHECPVCFRVFGSGQALGGHKRAHVMSGGCSPPATGSGTTDLDTAVKFERSFIDLNLPAPMEDGEIGSMVEVSDVSYAL